jgi:hypothetical protein
MMTPDQARNTAKVYRMLMDSEDESSWDEVDTCLDLLEYLEDEQLVIEAGVVFSQHGGGQVTLSTEHPGSKQAATDIVDAVSSILSLFSETQNLHKNNRYILQYYLALSQVGEIVPDRSVKP